MQINSERNQNTLTVSVSGRADTTTSPELEKAILEQLDGVTLLVLDLREMTYISSSGLRVLLKAQKAMNLQGEMKVINVSDDIMEILEMTGFTAILTIG